MKIETPIIILLVVMFVGVGGAIANNCNGDECNMGGGGVSMVEVSGGSGIEVNTAAYAYTPKTSDKTSPQITFVKLNIGDFVIITLLTIMAYELYLIYGYVKELREILWRKIQK